MKIQSFEELLAGKNVIHRFENGDMGAGDTETVVTDAGVFVNFPHSEAPGVDFFDTLDSLESGDMPSKSWKY